MMSINLGQANIPSKQFLVIMVVVVSILLVSQSLIPLISAEEDDWETTETENFVIEYQPGYEDDVEYIGEVTENAYEELLETLPKDVSELDFDQPVHIRVYPGDMWSGSDWMLYWTDSTPVTINVQAESDSPAGNEWYERGLAHELVNLFIWNEVDQYEKYPSSRNPSWYGEGLSQYYVYQTPTVNPQFPPSSIEDLNETITAGAGTFATISDSMYHGGHLVSMYMIDVYGQQAVWDVLRSPEQHFHEAIEDGLGVSLQTFEMEWHRWAEENIGGNYSQMYDPDIVELENQLLEAENRIDELEVLLKDANETIEASEEDLADANETIEALEEDLADANETIEALEEDLADANETIETLEEDLADANETIEALEKGLADTNETIAHLQEQLTERNKELNAANQTIIDLEQQLSDLEEVLADANETISELEEELQQTNTTPTPTPGSEDGIPGPGIVGTVAGLGGAGYVLKRWRDNRAEGNG